ncbi:MAG: DnaJ domain-containing protein [Deltaproteobacteria bacterium]|nr:DnaJ domain-containing protein [Deltaproteobacteria bacterium]MBW2053819.1 DnaJ domain-containing protein [Deltaproteobacteria bacterium]MBW2142485.1 DnaJ domain-containing protein [Deltaproteobacteria bacterium]
MEHYYQVLNLTPKAEINDIKKAYRQLAKQFHPDSAQLGAGDAVRFQEIYEAYKALTRDQSKYALDFQASSSSTDFRSPDPADWHFEGVYEDGLNVVYLLKLSLRAARHGLRLSLPGKKEEACPRCLGVGYTYNPHSPLSSLKRSACPRCQTRGVISRNTIMEAEIDLEALKKGEYRLKRQGHYDPFTASRGDLIIKIEIDSGSSAWKNGSYNA